MSLTLPAELPDPMTRQQVAAVLNVHRDTVLRWLRTGKLRSLAKAEIQAILNGQGGGRR